MIKSKDIQIRDPFVFPEEREQRYYLYGTTDKDCFSDKSVGFDAYYSSDLENWVGPTPVFRPSSDFWAKENFWAPEIYHYNDEYYMFASFKAKGISRGTQILKSTSPLGPFIPHSLDPVTPKEWECLDGTLYVDHREQPWIIFCHEWLQVQDGEICAMKLSSDLKQNLGDPIVLFRASEAPWSRAFAYGSFSKNYVTDGPFLYQLKGGKLIMLWSTHGYDGYTIGISFSKSGNIIGPWEHYKNPLFSKDGGHGMLFSTFDKKLMLTIHMPNISSQERPIFIEVKEVDGNSICLV